MACLALLCLSAILPTRHLHSDVPLSLSRFHAGLLLARLQLFTGQQHTILS